MKLVALRHGDAIFSIVIGLGFMLCVGVSMLALRLMSREPAKAEFVYAPWALMLCAPFSVFPFVNLLVGCVMSNLIIWRLHAWKNTL